MFSHFITNFITHYIVKLGQLAIKLLLALVKILRTLKY